MQIDLKRIKVSRERKKVLIIAGIVIVACFVFIRLIYLPQGKRFEGLKKELQETNAEISQIKATAGISGQDVSMAKSLDALQKKLKAMDGKFPSKEEMVLREIPNFANRYGVQITTMQPSKKRVVTAIGGEAVGISGYVIEELQVGISAAGNYRNLGEYLRALRETFPTHVKINNLSLSIGGKKDLGILNISFSITTYLVAERHEG